MKVRKFLFPMMLALAVSFTACGDDEPEESCDGENLGEEMCTNDFDAVATFCSDGENNSYYTFAGEKYECSGIEATTCEDALYDIGVKIIEQGCETSKSAEIAAKAKLTEMSKELLAQVRMESILN